MDPLLEAAERCGVAVIEDAAQAIGAAYKGRQAGSMGKAGCFSFFPSKNLGAFGDAGLLTTGDEAFAHDVRLLRNHGAEPKYFHKRIGGNFRLDALQAAVLRVKLPHLEGWSARRRENADRYDRLFAESAAADRITRPARHPDCRHIFNQYVVRVHRDRARRRPRASRGRAGSGPRSITRCRFTCRSVSRRSDTGAGTFPPPRPRPRKRWRCPSTASSPRRSSAKSSTPWLGCGQDRDR